MNPSEIPVFQGPQPIDDPNLKWELFWEKHKTAILGAIVLLIVAALAASAWLVYFNAQRHAAQKLLAEATDIAAFQAVVDKYPKSQAAADSLLRIAAAEREAGDLTKSTAAFQAFLDRFPDHTLAGGALLGIGQNQDATGDSDSAIASYQLVVTRYPQSYAAPFAAYSEAEILLRRFQRDEARRSYNMIVSQFPQSLAARMASSQLSRIGNNQAPPSPAAILQPATTAEPVPAQPTTP
jgi:TolA-binding protein